MRYIWHQIVPAVFRDSNSVSTAQDRNLPLHKREFRHANIRQTNSVSVTNRGSCFANKLARDSKNNGHAHDRIDDQNGGQQSKPTLKR
jgi:hypothetical protein